MKHKSLSAGTLAISAFIALGFSAAARSAVIDLSAYGWMAQTDPGVDLTILSTANNGVTLALEKFADFTAPPASDGTIAPLNIVFQQISLTAVPNIAITDEVVVNDTGASWSGFTFSITGGLPNDNLLPQFDQALSANFSIDPFTARAYSADGRSLLVADGQLSGIAFPDNLFRPGHAAGQLVIAAQPFAAGVAEQTFTFVEQPSTVAHLPEPSSTLVILAASVGILGSRRGRSLR